MWKTKRKSFVVYKGNEDFEQIVQEACNFIDSLKDDQVFNITECVTPDGDMKIIVWYCEWEDQ